MKNLNNFVKIIASTLILCLACACIQSPPTDVEEKTRIVQVSSEATMSYEEIGEKFLSALDSYMGQVSTDGVLSFSATQTIDSGSISGIDFVSTNNEKIIKTYETQFDVETNCFFATTNYYNNHQLIKQEVTQVEPFYLEEDDDWVFVLDGNIVSLSETLNVENVENCAMVLDDAIVVATVLIVATMIVCYPHIENIATTTVKTVKTWVSSFVGWLKGKFKTKKETVSVVTRQYFYKVKVDSKEYTLTQVKDSTRKFVQGEYYIAIADTESGFVYISTESVSETIAIAILSSTKSVNAVSGSGRTFVLSTYTFLPNDAKRIAEFAASIMGGTGAVLHTYHQMDSKGKKRKGVFYQHYHPCMPYVSGSAHSFFGSPVINI